MSKIYGIKSINGNLADVDGNIDVAVERIEITTNDLLNLALYDGIPIGVSYKITDFDPTLYGGTDILATSISGSDITSDCIGIFYTPKYTTDPGFGIWSNLMPVTFDGGFGFQGFFDADEIVISNGGALGYLKCDGLIEYISGNWNTATMITGSSSGATVSLFGSVSSPTYSQFDTVHWGGKTWENVNGNVGSAIDIYTLDSEWTAIPYNDADYNVSYDKIKVDYKNADGFVGKIVSRIDKAGNEVSFNYLYLNGLSNPAMENPIRLFQWGNYDLTNGTGIYMNKVIDSKFECINNMGFIDNNIISNNSDVSNNIFSIDCYLSNNNLDRSTMDDNRFRQADISNTLIDSDISNNRVYYNTLVRNVLKEGSSISDNNLTINGQFHGNILNNSYITGNLSFNCYLNNNILDSSYLNNNKLFGTNKNISNNTLLRESYLINNEIKGGDITYNNLDFSYISTNIINTLSGASSIKGNILLDSKMENNIINGYISSLDDNRLSNDSIISNNSLIGDNSIILSNVLEQTSEIDNNILGTNSTIDYNRISVYSMINNNTITNSSYIYGNMISTECNVNGNTLGTNSTILSNTVVDGSYINNNFSSNNSRIENNSILNFSGVIGKFNNSNIRLSSIVNSSELDFNSSGTFSSKTITYTEFNGIISSIPDISAATIIFGLYPKSVTQRQDGTIRVVYINNSDTQIITSITT